MIYRKLIKRESRVVVAIEADDSKEADKIFEEWYSNDDNIESVSQLLAEREKDFEQSQAPFPNWESLNRSVLICPDFIIEKQDEPKYDLYFFIDEKRKYCYPGLTMKRVVQELDYYDRTYKLTEVPIISHFNDINYSTKNKIMVFEAVKRSEDK